MTEIYLKGRHIERINIHDEFKQNHYTVELVDDYGVVRKGTIKMEP